MDALKVAVLGCGPTGLLAAHGALLGAVAAERKVELKVFSRRQKSPLFGCQYLHSSIRELKVESRNVRYLLQGTADGYRRKVYGENSDAEVSPDALESSHRAWNIREAYDKLWDAYRDVISDYFFTSGTWQSLEAQLRRDGFTMFISSLPQPILCRRLPECSFGAQEVWAMGDAPALGRYAVLPGTMHEDTIVCSGRAQDPWYRVAKVFGHATVEWPASNGFKPPPGASLVRKPLSTTCLCNPNVIRVGRFGRWEKGVLADSAFWDGYRAVQAR